MRSIELHPRGQHTVGANSKWVELSKLARLTLMAATFFFGPSVHAGNCLRDGVPAFQVLAPNGAVSVLIGSVHSAFEGLCLPSSRIMKGKKRYVVEGIYHPSLNEDATSAPAALLLEKQRLELPPGFEHWPRQAWSKALTDSQIVELRRRAECRGYQPAVVGLAIRLPSAAFAADFALRPCAPSGILAGDEQLARAAAAEGLWAFALETQPEANLQRDKVPERVHQHNVYRGMSADSMRVSRRAIAAFNAGQYERLLAEVNSLAKSAEDAALFNRLMLTNRNKAWMPRLTSYLDQGDALVNVGAAHLAGPDGLPALLRANGYRVKKVRLPAAAGS